MDKIIIFTNSYMPVLGGIQTVTSQLAKGLKKDYDVREITNKYPKNLKGKELVDGIHVNRFYLGNFYGSLNYLKGIVMRLSSVLMFVINIIKLSLLFNRESPKVTNPNYDLLRATACFLVVAHHIIPESQTYFRFVTSPCVPLFLILSGLLLLNKQYDTIIFIKKDFQNY